MRNGFFCLSPKQSNGECHARLSCVQGAIRSPRQTGLGVTGTLEHPSRHYPGPPTAHRREPKAVHQGPSLSGHVGALLRAKRLGLPRCVTPWGVGNVPARAHSPVSASPSGSASRDAQLSSHRPNAVTQTPASWLGAGSPVTQAAREGLQTPWKQDSPRRSSGSLYRAGTKVVSFSLDPWSADTETITSTMQ